MFLFPPHLFPAPEEHFGIKPSCYTVPHKLGGLGGANGRLGKRGSHIQLHAPSLVSSRKEYPTGIATGQLDGLLIEESHSVKTTILSTKPHFV